MSCLGGYMAHSLAIMTDAAHLLTDFASMLLSLFSLWMSSRPATKTMNFGWHRAGELSVTDVQVWDRHGLNWELKDGENITIVHNRELGNVILQIEL